MGLSQQAVATLAGMLAGGADPPEVVTRACHVAAEASGASRVSVVACADSGDLVVLGSSDAAGHALSSWQVEQRQGPSVEVCRVGRPLVVPRIDAAAGRHWPGYAALATQAGALSLWCMPVTAGGQLLGAMEGHDRRAGMPDGSTAADLRALATVTGVLLLRSGLRDRAERLSGRLERALRELVAVEQACGRLAERHGIDVEEAFTRLAAHARARGEPLHEVAGAMARERLPP